MAAVRVCNRGGALMAGVVADDDRNLEVGGAGN